MTEITRYLSRPCPGNRKKCEAAMREKDKVIEQLRKALDAIGYARVIDDGEPPENEVKALRRIAKSALKAGKGKSC